jgi:hypothetical protein
MVQGRYRYKRWPRHQSDIAAVFSRSGALHVEVETTLDNSALLPSTSKSALWSPCLGSELINPSTPTIR